MTGSLKIKKDKYAAKRTGKTQPKMFGKSYADNDYVLKWDNGCPFLPDYVTHRFAALLKKYDLPHIRFHEL